MKLSKLLHELDYELLSGAENVEITSLVYDSRKVEKGSVFVCISGSVRDAHDFIDEVIEKGAAAIVVEKDVPCKEGVTYIKTANNRLALACMSAAYFDYPARQIKTIGITGTKGKTTTTYMVKSILELSGIKTGLGPLNRLSETVIFHPKIRHRNLMWFRKHSARWLMRDLTQLSWKYLPRR